MVSTAVGPPREGSPVQASRQRSCLGGGNWAKRSELGKGLLNTAELAVGE